MYALYPSSIGHSFICYSRETLLIKYTWKLSLELRRLNWLQQHLAEIGNASPAPRVGDEPTIFLSSSIRALRREREISGKEDFTFKCGRETGIVSRGNCSL
eukprot:XP_015584360.1 kinesin-like protein NACK1 [Ricinus communis]